MMRGWSGRLRKMLHRWPKFTPKRVRRHCTKGKKEETIFERRTPYYGATGATDAKPAKCNRQEKVPFRGGLLFFFIPSTKDPVQSYRSFSALGLPLQQRRRIRSSSFAPMVVLRLNRNSEDVKVEMICVSSFDRWPPSAASILFSKALFPPKLRLLNGEN